jgi:hypothetical protein
VSEETPAPVGKWWGSTSLRGRPFRGRQLHFIHVRKTAGVAVKTALAPHARTERFQVVFHGHGTKLDDLPRPSWFFFSTRDPIARYVSGFYSRQRQGRPRFDRPWTADERIAFERFSTANDLAEALDGPDGTTREAAEHAMRTIAHVRHSYWWWFGDRDAFLSRSDHLFAILRQEHLAEDFRALVERLGLDPRIVRLPEDETSSHRGPEDVDRRLTERATGNLRRWYADDYAFVALCEELRAR